MKAFESRVGNIFAKKSIEKNTMSERRMSFKRPKEKQLANFKFQLAAAEEKMRQNLRENHNWQRKILSRRRKSNCHRGTYNGED